MDRHETIASPSYGKGLVINMKRLLYILLFVMILTIVGCDNHTHVGNDRGPEICRMDWLEGGSAGGKDNRYVVSIYAIDINKK